MLLAVDVQCVHLGLKMFLLEYFNVRRLGYFSRKSRLSRVVELSCHSSSVWIELIRFIVTLGIVLF